MLCCRSYDLENVLRLRNVSTAHTRHQTGQQQKQMTALSVQINQALPLVPLART